MQTITKNETKRVLKPVQAGDYGQPAPKTDAKKDTATDANTDGRKVLSLWSH
ncbi:MAG: hypothetical protein JKY71_10015 [Alphaproteobacteria bacterium]|nr:hypothetical protein [Alphaproteobacteria bacterium]